VISQWLGHADPAFTMGTYLHSQDDALKLPAETLQRVDTVVTASRPSNTFDTDWVANT
jgi:hypothetical protein